MDELKNSKARDFASKRLQELGGDENTVITELMKKFGVDHDLALRIVHAAHSNLMDTDSMENAVKTLQERAAEGREAYGSPMKNEGRISLMFDSPSVAQRAEGLIRTSAHPELSGSSVVVDYSALGGVHEDLKAEDLMQYLGSETMK